jgi:hypothetical protein
MIGEIHFVVPRYWPTVSHVSTLAKETWRRGEEHVVVVEVILAIAFFDIVPGED